MTTTARLAELVACYQQQLAAYQTMLALAEEQRNCVQTGNYPVLAEILERRDRLQSEIMDSSARVRELCQQISQALGLEELNLTNLQRKISDEVLDPLATVLAEITKIIEKIQATDEQSEAQLKQVLDVLRGQMTEVQRGQAAMRAYKQAPVAREARFIDKKK